MEYDIKKIVSKLDNLKEEISYIKENMVNKDDVILNEEKESYLRSFDKNNLVSEEEAKRILKV